MVLFFFFGCSDALGVGGFANERSELATDLGCLHTTLVWCGWLRLWVWCAAVLCDPRLWCRVVPSGPRKHPPVCCGPARTGGWAGRPKVMLRKLVRSNSPARRGGVRRTTVRPSANLVFSRKLVCKHKGALVRVNLFALSRTRLYLAPSRVCKARAAGLVLVHKCARTSEARSGP